MEKRESDAVGARVPVLGEHFAFFSHSGMETLGEEIEHSTLFSFCHRIPLMHSSVLPYRVSLSSEAFQFQAG